MARGQECPCHTGEFAIMAKSKLNILYGESDQEVLASQAVSIQKAGHQVKTALGRKGVEEALRQGSFDLVILGSSMNKNDRHHLPYMVKKANQGTRVLVMHADGARHPQVDGMIDSGRTMEALLETIASMMSQQKAMAAGAGR
jgi:DNA-binding NtrC family response regulator